MEKTGHPLMWKVSLRSLSMTAVITWYFQVEGMQPKTWISVPATRWMCSWKKTPITKTKSYNWGIVLNGGKKFPGDRNSVGEGKSGSGRVDLGGRRYNKKKKKE